MNHEYMYADTGVVGSEEGEWGVGRPEENYSNCKCIGIAKLQIGGALLYTRILEC